ncbi:sulfite exporter TauE/SafE family protein [Pseudodesulfovibrio sediminis]|uniref:Probable membrane transporter protein n=1 Tax=Pseudodesulfovibrio sediminis TaxID=2810563 RepID=A0ABM7P3B0_9BACT|nr:sulfite exporter TauE/SafE family protein [Pseudodesulfovibrio sediminis]BCS87264.1 hypothetical protein PSDVSF_05060 [Pseudodesulfovibrio sediminis]
MFDTISIISIVLLAAFIQGLTGFGFGLIALPLLGFFIDIKTNVPLIVLLAVFISMTLSWQLRSHIHAKTIGILMAATIPGIVLGVYVLKLLSASTLSIGLGVIMVLFTIYQLLLKPKTRELGHTVACIAGFSSGVLGGSIGAGGPPVIIYSTIQPWSKDRSKATLAAYFTISAWAIVATHAYTGLITKTVLYHFMTTFPALIGGTLLGTFAYTRISDHGYRNIALILVLILGGILIYRNIQ